jgi:hypothetical protein
MPATRIGGRAVQRDELALCDLTGDGDGDSDGATGSKPAWRVEKNVVTVL